MENEDGTKEEWCGNRRGVRGRRRDGLSLLHVACEDELDSGAPTPTIVSWQQQFGGVGCTLGCTDIVLVVTSYSRRSDAGTERFSVTQLCGPSGAKVGSIQPESAIVRLVDRSEVESYSGCCMPVCPLCSHV